MTTAARHTTAALLDRRPEARTFSVQDLLEVVASGRLRIPSFQRGLKWNRMDARLLLESLFRGYPVGTLLLWEAAAPAGEVRFGSLTLPAPQMPNALWVVDGQQRIVSLARTLLAADPDSDDFALYVDLDAADFVAPPAIGKRRADPSRWLPMSVVLDAEKLMQWLLDHAAAPGSRQRRDTAIQLGRRLREYEIPAYIVRSDDQAILRDIFNRINSAGRSLDDSDVFDALNGSRFQSRPATIPQISSELEKLDFGRIEERILHRLLRVLLGLPVVESARSDPPRLTDTEAEAGVPADGGHRKPDYPVPQERCRHSALRPAALQAGVRDPGPVLPAPSSTVAAIARTAGTLDLARRAEWRSPGRHGFDAQGPGAHSPGK
jgi:hypothetical protein